MKLHAANKAFAWQGTHSPLRLLTQDQAQQFNELGYALLPSVFSDQEIEAVRRAIDPLEAAHEQWLRDEHDGRLLIARADAITFTAHLVTRSRVLKEFSCHPAFVALCRDVIGSGARLYWDQSVYKKPGYPEEFPWHQDNGYTYVEPQQYLTCWIPLTDATLDNGCPWVAPGKHKLGTLHHVYDGNGLRCLDEVPDAKAVPAQVGDVVVFSSLTPHRTGPNVTAQTRKTYILQYAPDGACVHLPNGDVAAANDPARQYQLEP